MKVLTSFVLLSMTVASLAQAQIQVGQASHAGTGCVAGSAQVKLSSNQSTLYVTFNQFDALAGGSTGRRIDRKACAIRLPIAVDAGYQVSIKAVDYRALVKVPSDGQVVLDATYSFIGSDEQTLNKSFSGPLKKIYYAKNDLKSLPGVVSECGQKDVVFAVNVSGRAVAGASMDATQIKMNSVQPILTYKIQVVKCP